MKYYGADALRYQYVPVEYSTSRYSQERSPTSPYNRIDNTRGSSKKVDSRKQIETPKWTTNIITSEYYGYDGMKEKKEEDDFIIQKKAKKTSFKVTGKDITNTDRNKRHSYYDNIANIP